MTTEEIYSAFLGAPHEGKTFFHGHSYTGNPLGCAAALANLSIFKTERTLTNVQRRTPRLSAFLNTLAHEPWVGDIRQCGYMVGIELVQSQQTKEPVPPIDHIGHRVTMAARALGLLIRPIGNTIILMPPLSATLQELKQMVDIIKVAISVVRASTNREQQS
jgi:adenosylmethionine-8-amino-7-oxononanoate aminotransferase